MPANDNKSEEKVLLCQMCRMAVNVLYDHGGVYVCPCCESENFIELADAFLSSGSLDNDEKLCD